MKRVCRASDASVSSRHAARMTAVARLASGVRVPGRAWTAGHSGMDSALGFMRCPAAAAAAWARWAASLARRRGRRRPTARMRRGRGGPCPSAASCFPHTKKNTKEKKKQPRVKCRAASPRALTSEVRKPGRASPAGRSTRDLPLGAGTGAISTWIVFSPWTTNRKSTVATDTWRPMPQKAQRRPKTQRPRVPRNPRLLRLRQKTRAHPRVHRAARRLAPRPTPRPLLMHHGLSRPLHGACSRPPKASPRLLLLIAAPPAPAGVHGTRGAC